MSEVMVALGTPSLRGGPVVMGRLVDLSGRLAQYAQAVSCACAVIFQRYSVPALGSFGIAALSELISELARSIRIPRTGPGFEVIQV